MKRLAHVLCMLALWLGSAATPCDTIISLITCYPGSDIYELEGHSALRITTPDADVAVSYGLFDFSAPHFVYRFVKGETDYHVGLLPWQYFYDSYLGEGRRIESQCLLLDSVQTRRALAYIADNLRPENAVYRYNYVKDNCATRPLAVIQHALGADSIGLPVPDFSRPGLARLVPPGAHPATFRECMRAFHHRYPWYQFGIDLALGAGIDYPLQAREYAFAPVLLAGQLEQARAAGDTHKVAAPELLTPFEADTSLQAPTPWWASPMCVCWCVFAALLAATIHDVRHRRVTRWVDASYFGIMGLAGLLLTFLIFVSVHEATSPNWLYLWLNPLCLIPAIFIWTKRGKMAVMSYQIANFAVLTLLVLLWPWLPQSANAAFLPLVLGDMLRAANYIYIQHNTLRKQNDK